MKYPRISGFIGHNGDSVWLTPLPDDHPIVLAHPNLFRAGPADAGKAKPATRRLGRVARKSQPVEPPSPLGEMQPDPPQPDPPLPDDVDG